jgi:hypothetical protein
MRSLDFVRAALGQRSVLVAAAVAAGAIAACSESAEGVPVVPPHEDGGSKLPEPDGASGDETTDGGAEAAADAAPPPVCSQENFCHTDLPKGQTVRAGWSDGEGVAWAVTSEGSILRWDGKAWAVHTSGLEPLLAIWGSGPTDVWVGADGGLYHGEGATSATLTFTAVDSLPGDPTPISAVWGTGPDDVWAVGPRPLPGYQGRVLHYTGASQGWSLDDVSAERVQFARVWGSTTSGVWLTGVRANPRNVAELGVLRRAPGESTFVDVPIPGDPAYPPDNQYAKLNTVWGVSGSSDDTVWIVGQQAFGVPGYVRGTTSDGGQTYTFSYTALGDKTFFLPNAVWGISADHAWLGGDFGRLRRWDGRAWKQAFITITKYPVIDPFYAIWGTGTEDVWIAGAGIAIHRDLTKHP